MAFEMICGQCRGNLLVEQFGVVVACPHCGAHLHVPAPADPVAPEPAPASITEELQAFTGEESEPPPSVEISVVPSIAISDAEQTPNADVTEETPVSAANDGSFSLSTLMAASATEPATAEPTPTNSEPLPVVSPPPTFAETAPPIEAALPMESVAPPPIPEPVAAPEPISEPIISPPSEAVSSGLSGLFGSSVSSPPAEAPTILVEHTSDDANTPISQAETTSPEQEHSEDSSPAESAHASTPAAPVVKPSGKDQVTISKTFFLILLSYACAITLGFTWVVIQLKTTGGGGGDIESLPDPVPAKKTGFQWYPPRVPMTAGHELRIGDSQRYGNINVTVVKVTRGPVRFKHFSDASKKMPPSFPVLKLWLKFENVSDDQKIAPLDDQLLFDRRGKNRSEYKSSQFVCRAAEMTKKSPKFVIAYDHKIGSGWDLADLPLDKSLAPHESRDYYVPTCEADFSELTGDLVWRVHFRKGYSRRGNGVTTLFEVHFDSQDIRDEAT